MATADFLHHDGERFTVIYDRLTPCITCDLPVLSASVGGTAICPWCDMGIYRDGSRHPLILKSEFNPHYEQDMADLRRHAALFAGEVHWRELALTYEAAKL